MASDLHVCAEMWNASQSANASQLAPNFQRETGLLPARGLTMWVKSLPKATVADGNKTSLPEATNKRLTCAQPRLSCTTGA